MTAEIFFKYESADNMRDNRETTIRDVRFGTTFWC